MSLKNKNILITYGPTWIPIDDTRIISNISSGRLGQIVAKELSNAGAKVTALEGPVAAGLQDKRIRTIKFNYYNEFLALIKKELKKKVDIVVHAAAVSDYKLKKPFTSKLSSTYKKLSLELVQTQKIINVIKRRRPKCQLVGFKLKSKMTKSLAKAKSEKLFKKSKCDFVIANSVRDGKYSGYILNKEGQFLAHEHSRKAMAKRLTKVLNQ